MLVISFFSSAAVTLNGCYTKDRKSRRTCIADQVLWKWFLRSEALPDPSLLAISGTGRTLSFLTEAGDHLS